MNKRQKKKRKKLEDMYEGWDSVSWKSKRKFDKSYKAFCDMTRHTKCIEPRHIDKALWF